MFTKHPYNTRYHYLTIGTSIIKWTRQINDVIDSESLSYTTDLFKRNMYFIANKDSFVSYIELADCQKNSICNKSYY